MNHNYIFHGKHVSHEKNISREKSVSHEKKGHETNMFVKNRFS